MINKIKNLFKLTFRNSKNEQFKTELAKKNKELEEIKYKIYHFITMTEEIVCRKYFKEYHRITFLGDPLSYCLRKLSNPGDLISDIDYYIKIELCELMIINRELKQENARLTEKYKHELDKYKAKYIQLLASVKVLDS